MFQFKNKEELNLGYNLIDSLITELLRDCVHFVKKIIKGESCNKLQKQGEHRISCKLRPYPWPP